MFWELRGCFSVRQRFWALWEQKPGFLFLTSLFSFGLKEWKKRKTKTIHSKLIEWMCLLEASSETSQRFFVDFLVYICCLVGFADFVNSNNKPLSPLVSASQQPKFSNSQILSIFPQHPVAGSPYPPPPYPPTAMAWGQQGFLGNQWPGPAVAPWPTLPTGSWANSGVQVEAQGCQPGGGNGGMAPPTPSLNVSGNLPNIGPDLLQ